MASFRQRDHSEKVMQVGRRLACSEYTLFIASYACFVCKSAIEGSAIVKSNADNVT